MRYSPRQSPVPSEFASRAAAAQNDVPSNVKPFLGRIIPTGDYAVKHAWKLITQILTQDLVEMALN